MSLNKGYIFLATETSMISGWGSLHVWSKIQEWHPIMWAGYDGSLHSLEEYSLLLFSRSVMSSSLWPHVLQHAGFSVLHHLVEFVQTDVHWVSDAIQPSHLLSSPSPPAFNLSQHQDLFQWVRILHQVAKVLELQLQHQSFQWIFRVDFL